MTKPKALRQILSVLFNLIIIDQTPKRYININKEHKITQKQS